MARPAPVRTHSLPAGMLQPPRWPSERLPGATAGSGKVSSISAPSGALLFHIVGFEQHPQVMLRTQRNKKCLRIPTKTDDSRLFRAAASRSINDAG